MSKRGELGVSDLGIAINSYEFPSPPERKKAPKLARRSSTSLFPETGSLPSAVPGSWSRSSRASSSCGRAFRPTRLPSSRHRTSSTRTATRLLLREGLRFVCIVEPLVGNNFLTVPEATKTCALRGTWWSGRVPRTTSPLSVLEGMVEISGETTLSPCKPVLAVKLQAKGR